MSKIRIKNFGPIKEGYKDSNGEEWMDIKKVTVFIGNQGSGKSTVAKLISTMVWIEKAMVKGVLGDSWMNSDNSFNKQCSYQNIGNYFKNNTEIEFKGKAFSFSYKDNRFEKTKNPPNGYLLPKIMYVPSERNFVAVIDQSGKLKYLPRTLVTFLDEYKLAMKGIIGGIELPINNTFLVVENGIAYISGNDYRIKLSEASSGFQASVPLYLVSKNLTEFVNQGADPSMRELSSEEVNKLRNDIEKILLNNTLDEEVKQESLRVLSSKYKVECYINIVEEPEQNLYPSSQRQVLNKLLEFNNMNNGNELIMTTHSPYLINYLTLAIKANEVLDKINVKHLDELKDNLSKIVPLNSVIKSEEIIVYELSEDGKIIKLPTYHGLPSDENYLNERMAEGNELFANLLDIEDKCI